MRAALFWPAVRFPENLPEKIERKFFLQPSLTYCIVILVNEIMQEKTVLTGMGNCYGKVSGDRGVAREGENDQKIFGFKL